jgi:hypothetical protein
MALQFEDVAKYGVVLIPPDSPEYDPPLADIQHRLDNPVAGSRPRLPGMNDRIAPEDRNASAILVNRSSQPIVSMAVAVRSFGRSDQISELLEYHPAGVKTVPRGR